MARCAGLGWACITFIRRHSYQPQTSDLSERKPFGLASMVASKFSYKPVCASRNVGIPLSAETPAPVYTTTFRAFLTLAIKSSANIIVPLKLYIQLVQSNGVLCALFPNMHYWVCKKLLCRTDATNYDGLKILSSIL